MSTPVLPYVQDDAQAIKAILASMGVASYEASVIPQLLAFKKIYTTNIIKRAQKIAMHANPHGSTMIKPSDVSLAIKSGGNARRADAGTHGALLETAQIVNRKPIERISQTFGLIIPKDAPAAVCPLNENYIVTVNEPLDPTTNAEKSATSKVSADDSNGDAVENGDSSGDSAVDVTIASSSRSRRDGSNSRKRSAPDDSVIDAFETKKQRT